MALKEIPRIKSVMTAFPYWVEGDASLRRARELMSHHEIRHLPVKEGQSLVGVLTDRDLKRALDAELGLGSRDDLVVADIMVRDAYVVDLNARLDGVLRELAERHIGSCIVQKEGRLVGIFTATDACRVLADYLEDRFPEPGDDDVA